jgi:propanol-preferring alcohol dehydrogenase
MRATYRAVQITKPDEFAVLTKALADTGPGQVRIRVEACGVCHSDQATVEGVFGYYAKRKKAS